VLLVLVLVVLPDRSWGPGRGRRARAGRGRRGACGSRKTHAAKVGLASRSLITAWFLAPPSSAVCDAKVGLACRSLITAWFLASLATAVPLAKVGLAYRSLVAAWTRL